MNFKHILLLSILSSGITYGDEFGEIFLEESKIISTTGFETSIKNVASNPTVITAKDIQEKNYQSVDEILSTIPAVNIINQGGDKIIDLRGQGEKAKTNVQVLVDGIQMNSLDTSMTATPINTIDVNSYKYLIGAGDVVNIFVWRNPEVSGTVIVRPDGMITTSLVEDIPVSGKTPTELARSIEEILATYLRDPVVTVTVNNFVGPFSEQIRVIGEATEPQSISYTQHMTLLDVMIRVGGLTEFANGNGAILVRVEEGIQRQYDIFIEDLIKNGEISANVDMLPGDIIVIPETWF